MVFATLANGLYGLVEMEKGKARETTFRGLTDAAWEIDTFEQTKQRLTQMRQKSTGDPDCSDPTDLKIPYPIGA